MSEKKIIIQKIWGVLLLTAGIGIFITIPSKVKDIESAGVYLSNNTIIFQVFSYIMSLILIVGGVKKLYNYFWLKSKTKDEPESK